MREKTGLKKAHKWSQQYSQHRKYLNIFMFKMSRILLNTRNTNFPDAHSPGDKQQTALS